MTSSVHWLKGPQLRTIILTFNIILSYNNPVIVLAFFSRANGYASLFTLKKE